MAPLTEAAVPTDSTHITIPFLSFAMCRSEINANVEPQHPEDLAALKRIATDLYHELLADDAVITEMTNNMSVTQKRVASTNLYEAGFVGASGGMMRAAERHKVLAASEAAGIK
ncbi:hypothetical protein ABIE30_000657 [Janthinobacterium lividum]|uniref:hypothetical protein n=1 Tax=Janthinobacterium lividum TaxID=29581 RepID=UPI003D21F641